MGINASMARRWVSVAGNRSLGIRPDLARSMGMPGNDRLGIICQVARLLFACPGNSGVGIIPRGAGTLGGFGTPFMGIKGPLAEP